MRHEVEIRHRIYEPEHLVRGIDLSRTPPNVLVTVNDIRKTEGAVELLQSEEIKPYLYAPRICGIVLIDVVGYSIYETLGQAAILSLLKESINIALVAQKIYSTDTIIELLVPTGDGCYFVFINQCRL